VSGAGKLPELRFSAVKVVLVEVGGDCRGARDEGGLIRRMLDWLGAEGIAPLGGKDRAVGSFLGFFRAADARRLRCWLVEQPEIVVGRSTDETEAGD
jgi:hypothetical protein